MINKRTDNTRQKNILKSRYKLEDGEIKSLTAKKYCSFRIEKEWFNDGGSEYDDSKAPVPTIVPDEEMNMNYYMRKIKELQEELKLV